jgi:phage major head subunit gpT-like protein
MAIVTPALLQSLKTGFKGEFAHGLEMAAPQWTKAASRIPSSTASNTYGWLGQFPGFREWVGDRALKDMAAQGYQITNKLFESTVSVKRTDIEDDSIGVYAPLFQEMGRASQVKVDPRVKTEITWI